MSGPTGHREFMPAVSDDLPPGERPMIAVLHAVPGHETQLAAAVMTLAAAVRREPGCREFRAFRGIDAPGTFHLYEIYDDVQAFRAHLATGHVARFFSELAAHSTADAQALTQLVELHTPGQS
ncbi:putative quinol monooxygenase [Plantactinospora siamensis]|uniref:Quinol monooxygenase n=1 Tax=Plantactinospora siamensis TaxID=555372 RepID=A0ABV6P5I7_9ACTN